MIHSHWGSREAGQMAIKSLPDSREGAKETESSDGKRMSEFQMAFLLLWRSQQEGDTIQSVTTIGSETFSHCCSQDQFICSRLRPEEGPVRVMTESTCSWHFGQVLESKLQVRVQDIFMFLVLFLSLSPRSYFYGIGFGPQVRVHDHIFIVLVLDPRQSLRPYFHDLGLGSHVLECFHGLGLWVQI